MKKLSTLVLAAAMTAFSSAACAQLSLVTSRAAFPTTDSVDWSVLGPPFTTITSPFTVATTGGSTVDVYHDEGTLFERRDQSTGGWGGNFNFGEALLWNRGDNGSITFDPSNLVFGAGFNVQADFAGLFTFKLEAFDTDGGSLGSVSRTGFSNSTLGMAVFIGFLSNSANVDKFVGTLTSSVAGPSNFAINSLALSAPSPAVGGAVPEPSTYGLIGGVVVLLAAAHRRFRRHSLAI